MAISDPGNLTPAHLSDPNWTPEDLVEVVSVRPDLAFAVVRHPNCPPELIARVQQSNAPGWPSGPQQPFQPGNVPPNQPPQAGYQPPPGYNQPPNPATPGQPGPAWGAPPAGVAGPGQQGQGGPTPPIGDVVNDLWQQHPGITPMGLWARRSLVLIPGIALLAIISLFLPAGTVSVFGASVSVSFMSGGDGPILLVLYLAAVGFAIAAAFTRAPWARLTTGITAALAGLVSLIDSINVATSVGDASAYGVGVSLGFGAILLIILGIAIIAVGALVVIDSVQRRGQVNR